MKVLIVLAVLVGLVLASRFVMGLRGNRIVERPMDTLATIRVPARLEPWAPRTTWLGTTFRLSRFMNSIRAMGSSTPTHEDLVVTQVEPRQMARLGDQVLRHTHEAFEHLDDVTWEPWTTLGTARTRVGSARYIPNGLNDPAWLAQVIDAGRGLVVSYRGLQKDLSQAAATALVDSTLTSFTLTTDPATWFASVERDLGAGIHLSLPVEFFDPYTMEFDPSGLHWMLFRHHPEAVEDRVLLERALAIAAFFAPGNTTQEGTARGLLRQEMLREGALQGLPDAADGDVEVAVLHHVVGGRSEPAWLATAFDPARGIGIALRRWQRDATREEVVGIVRRALASYRFEGDPAWFGPIGGTP